MANKIAAMQTMASFGNTHLRDDLKQVTVPTLIVHGDADAIVPFEGSGKRSHEAVPGSEVPVIASGPHGSEDRRSKAGMLCP